VLLCTDAAGEGLNLHHHCRLVVTLELPWNPMRLEQRIGRVDRIGQRQRVHAVHIVGRDTPEIRVLEHLRHRISRAQADIGSANPLGSAVDDEMAIARALVDETGTQEAPSEPPAIDVTKVDLADDAHDEASRLMTARRLIGTARIDEVDFDRACFTFARRTRMSAARALLLIFKIDYDDASGRSIESTLVPVAVCSSTRSRAARRQLLDAMTILRPPELDRLLLEASRQWRERTRTLSRANLETRLHREHGVEARFSAYVETQPGLFDRRSSLLFENAKAASAEAARESALRIAAFEGRTHADFQPPRLLLALVG
jgi:hypothetical protein